MLEQYGKFFDFIRSIDLALCGFIVVVCAIGISVPILILYTCCYSRSLQTDSFEQPIQFSQGIELPIQMTHAITHGETFVGDFSCDGIADVAQIQVSEELEDTIQVVIFPGEYIERELSFRDNPSPPKSILFDKVFLNDMNALNSADINNDGCKDVVYAQYDDVTFFTDRLHITSAVSTKTGVYQIQKISLGLEMKLTPSLCASPQCVNVFDDQTDFSQIRWADDNGDGLDDLIIVWNAPLSNDMMLDVFHTSIGQDNHIEISQARTVTLDNFMAERSIYNVFFDDVDGDRRDDLIVYSPGKNFVISVALNTETSFSPHQDWILENRPYETLNRHSFVVGSFDHNQDGLADVFYIDFSLEKRGKIGMSVFHGTGR